MLDLNASKLSLVNATTKNVRWIFSVTDSNGTGYKWSTTSYTQDYARINWESGVQWETGIAWDFADDSYAFKIIDFKGITFKRSSSEYNIQAPSRLTFSATNKNDTLTASDFVNGNVLVTLILESSTSIEDIAEWKFIIKKCDPQYQILKFTCEDFLQQYLDGDYPKDQLTSGVSQTSTYSQTKDVCFPVPFGTCYVPLTPMLSGNEMYYLLGPTDKTYTVTKISTPTNIGSGVTEFISDNYTFTQSSQSFSSINIRVFQPIIMDTNNDGTADYIGLWNSGDIFYDAPVEFRRSDTSGTTNPSDVIDFILQDFGLSSGDIGSSSFKIARATYNTWGLGFTGAIYKKEARKKIISSLLTQCNSFLRVTSQVDLYPMDVGSKKEIDIADIQNLNEVGPGSFTYNSVENIISDSGYVGFIPDGTPQVNYTNVLIKPSGTSVYISSNILETPLVRDNQDAQRIGELYYQKKYHPQATINFIGKSHLLTIQPDDVITINHSNYGGSYPILVDSVTINKDLSIRIIGTKFNPILDNFTDSTPDSITVVTNPVIQSNFPIVSGNVVEIPIVLDSTSTGICRVVMDSSVTPSTMTFDMPSGIIQPKEHFTTDLGTNTQAFDEAYADNWNNVADLYFMDVIDDLGLIEAIKTSGVTDEQTGFELIDDSTIPEQLLVKDDKKKILRDPSGKPWMTNRVLFSLLMGSIKQLHEKIKDIKNG